jgi:hypothetical protein
MEDDILASTAVTVVGVSTAVTGVIVSTTAFTFLGRLSGTAEIAFSQLSLLSFIKYKAFVVEFLPNTLYFGTGQ